MRPPLRTLLAGVAGVALLSLSACQDEEPKGSPDGSSTTSEATASASPSASPTPSGSTSPTTGSTVFPGVTPASGPELVVAMTSVHAPEGWKLLDQIVPYSISAGGRGGRVQLIEMDNAADIPLESRARIFLEGQEDGTTSKRLPNVLLGEPGLEAVRFKWTEKGEDTVHETVLTWRNGSSVTLVFDAEPALLERDPDFVDSVLASVQWVA